MDLIYLIGIGVFCLLTIGMAVGCERLSEDAK